MLKHFFLHIFNVNTTFLHNILIFPNRFNGFCFSECTLMDIGPYVCNSHTSFIWSQGSNNNPFPIHSLHLNVDNDKRLEMDAKAFSRAPSDSKAKFISNQHGPHHCVSGRRPTAGPNSGVEAWGRGGLWAAEEAGLPLILSSFIPSCSIITLSGRGYPPSLWSVYQLLSAARPRTTRWLSWDWWGDVTAGWAKPNQMLGRITHPPATCGSGTLTMMHVAFLTLY